jgi:thioredoxin reductase (NADPH)
LAVTTEPLQPIAEEHHTDVLVIGAGPVGLYQAFQLGLLGLRCAVVDALPHVGGQAAELYPDKPIYDIPGIPFCTGRGLADALLQQLRPLNVPLFVGQTITHLRRDDATATFELRSSAAQAFRCHAVVVAAGVGAFEPRRINLPELRALEGRQVFFFDDALPQLTGKHVVVSGGEEQAIASALALEHTAASVTLLHRRDTLSASEAAAEAWQAALARGRVRLVAGLPSQARLGPHGLTHLQITEPSGSSRDLPCDAVLVRQGLSPKLGALAEWGLVLEKKQLPVDTSTFATRQPGVYAVGDVVTYPAKKRLIVCGFHEAAMCAYALLEALKPADAGPLQYTTTSALLQQRLGVRQEKLAQSPNTA